MGSPAAGGEVRGNIPIACRATVAQSVLACFLLLDAQLG